MTGRASREKGARAERELANLLAENLSLEIRRNLIQYQSGGFDLTGLPWALEVKRCETLNIKGWWTQACQQSEAGPEADKLPALAYRRSRQPWRFVVPAHVCIAHYWPSVEIDHTIETGINVFVHLTRLRLAEGVNHENNA